MFKKIKMLKRIKNAIFIWNTAPRYALLQPGDR